MSGVSRRCIRHWPKAASRCDRAGGGAAARLARAGNTALKGEGGVAEGVWVGV